MTVRNQRSLIASPYDSISVTAQENYALPLFLYFHKLVTSTTAASAATKDTNYIVVTSATGMVVDQQMIIVNPASNRLTEGFITAIVGTTITLTTPFEYDVEAGDMVYTFTIDIDVDGSTTRETFSVENLGIEGISPDVIIHTVTMQIITDTATEFTDFGDIAGGLTNGVVFRGNDGVITNFATARDNKDLRLYSSEYIALDASNPGLGVYGLIAKFDISGLENYGAAIRLRSGEKLEFIIQDDLTSLVSVKIAAKGHLEVLK